MKRSGRLKNAAHSQTCYMTWELQPPSNPRPHRSTAAPSRLRLAEVARWPTKPVPASMWKFTKSIEFPLLSETLLAAVTVRPVMPEEKKFCSEV